MLKKNYHLCVWVAILVLEVSTGLRFSGKVIESWDEYANSWIESDKAKNLVCDDPPSSVSITKKHIYQCCPVDGTWRKTEVTRLPIGRQRSPLEVIRDERLYLRQEISNLVWDDVALSNITSDNILFKAEHDNHGSTMDEFRISEERRREASYTWSVSNGFSSEFGGSLTLGFPDLGFGGEASLGISMNMNTLEAKTKKFTKAFKIHQTFKVPPGKRVEVHWLTTDQTLNIKWHADVILKGWVGVEWYDGWYFGRYLPICKKYNWMWPVGRMSDGKTWHNSDHDLRFRIEGVFEGAHSYGSQLVNRECDVDKPKDCEK